MSELQTLRRELRELRRDMKDKGVRRTSCFNGGLDAQTFHYNSRVFALESKILDLLKRGRKAK